MNTKVEKALGVLEGAERSFVVLQQLVVMVNANADYIAAANEVRTARTTLAAHIAQQDATIARLREALERIKTLNYTDKLDAADIALAALTQEQVK